MIERSPHQTVMATTGGGTSSNAYQADDESLLAPPLKHEMCVEQNDTSSKAMDHGDLLDWQELNHLLNDPELQNLVHSFMNDQILEPKDDDIASILAQGANERDEPFDATDDAQEQADERRPETVKREGTHQPELSQIPFAKITDPKRLAIHLRRNYTAFAALDEQCIIRLLQHGAKMGIQPRVSPCTEQQAQRSCVLPSRRGRKRGPYKMTKKDSWTSTRSGGASQSALQNATQNKRSPPSLFKKRYLCVNEIGLHRESMGVAEVAPFKEYERRASVKATKKSPPLLCGDYERCEGKAARGERISDVGYEAEPEADCAILLYSDTVEDGGYTNNVDIIRRRMNSDRTAAV